MKRWIKSRSYNDVIFEDEYFEFVETQGIGMNDTPWEGLKVITKEGPAKDHVVEVRLNYGNNPKFDGEPVKYTYKDAYVAYGLPTRVPTLDETREFITVLEDAIEFAEAVNKYLWENN